MTTSTKIGSGYLGFMNSKTNLEEKLQFRNSMPKLENCTIFQAKNSNQIQFFFGPDMIWSTLVWVIHTWSDYSWTYLNSFELYFKIYNHHEFFFIFLIFFELYEILDVILLFLIFIGHKICKAMSELTGLLM